MLMSGAKFLFDLVVTKFPFDTEQKIILWNKTIWEKFPGNPTPSGFLSKTNDISISQVAETAVLTVVSKRDSLQEGRGKCPEGKEEEEWSCLEENADGKVARSDHAG